MKILLPVPDRDFDTTEVAVPWRVLTELGHEITFATESGGTTPACDPLLITGVLFGQLGAEPPAIADYRKLTEAPEFRAPIAWADIEPADYDGLLLPGGHAPGMRQYLGSAQLRQQVAAFWKLDRPVAAICHGVLVLARTVDPDTGNSVLHDRRTTCLPKYLERGGYFATAWLRGRYYRTYPSYVEDEVRAALAGPAQFERGAHTITRGTETDDTHAFTVVDGNYLSARWPGDAYQFAHRFHELLG